MKIAVTGSLGLIGSSLIERLQKIDNVKSVGYDIRYDKESPYYLDIAKKLEAKEKLADFDIIIHLAAVSRVAPAENDPEFCNNVNVDGTQNIIDVCLSSNKEPYLIFASSREVYGNQEIIPVCESAILNPINTYADSKLTCERLIIEAQKKGLKCFIARFSNIYGGMYDHNTRVIPSFCINALRNQDIVIKRNDTILDFLFIDDAIDAILKIINFTQTHNHNYVPIINICNGRATSLEKLSQTIISETKSNSKVVNLPKANFAVDKFCGSNALAHQILEWNPKFDLEAGIKKFIDDLNSQAKGNLNLKNINKRSEKYENFKGHSWLPSEI